MTNSQISERIDRLEYPGKFLLWSGPAVKRYRADVLTWSIHAKRLLPHAAPSEHLDGLNTPSPHNQCTDPPANFSPKTVKHQIWTALISSNKDVMFCCTQTNDSLPLSWQGFPDFFSWGLTYKKTLLDVNYPQVNRIAQTAGIWESTWRGRQTDL